MSGRNVIDAALIALAGLGSAAYQPSNAFDASGAAAAVQANLNTLSSSLGSAAFLSSGTFLQATNNLGDVSSSVQARVKLGLVGDAANSGNIFVYNMAATHSANLFLQSGSTSGGSVSLLSITLPSISGALSTASQTNYGGLGTNATPSFSSLHLSAGVYIGGSGTVQGSFGISGNTSLSTTTVNQSGSAVPFTINQAAGQYGEGTDLLQIGDGEGTLYVTADSYGGFNEWIQTNMFAVTINYETAATGNSPDGAEFYSGICTGGVS